MAVMSDFSFEVTTTASTNTTDNTTIGFTADATIEYFVAFPPDWSDVILTDSEKLQADFRMRVKAYRRGLFGDKPIQYMIIQKTAQFSNHDRKLKSRHRNHKGKEALR